MSPSGPVLSFAREAGGAAAIAPVCRAIRAQGQRLLLLAKGPAVAAFADRDLDCVEIGSFDTAEIDNACGESFGRLPAVVFTSATSLPTLDMTERLLWGWAWKHGVPSAAMVDQWQNYAIRFSGREPGERLAYLPDRILVMDQIAYREAVADGVPRERLTITGQPALDDIRHQHETIAVQGRSLRTAQSIPAGVRVVTFIAESLAADYGDTLGYDEQSTLSFLGDALQSLGRSAGPLLLAIKLHPQNDAGLFGWALDRWPELDVRLYARELAPRALIAMSDLVVGMSSVMLIESIMAGKPTLSLELESKREPQLVATRAGVLPFLRDRDAASSALRALLVDPDTLTRHLARQKTWDLPSDAVTRCLDVLTAL